ncbi:hypothetical protein J1614_006825 [Plenodomus biglobosus]|nr:hypothetical protein J1614_006825 [Plenodomus biglobosus]
MRCFNQNDLSPEHNTVAALLQGYPPTPTCRLYKHNHHLMSMSDVRNEHTPQTPASILCGVMKWLVAKPTEDERFSRWKAYLNADVQQYSSNKRNLLCIGCRSPTHTTHREKAKIRPTQGSRDFNRMGRPNRY